MGMLKNYLVAIYALLPEKSQLRPRPIGSGTFVEAGGAHYVLTAAHVWRETREAEKIGLALTDHQSSFAILRDAIAAQELWGEKISEWGPDLALLRLAPAYVATIKAHKSFLNLVQQKEAFASCQPVIEKGLWAITGMEGKSTEVQSYPEARIVECHIRGEAFFSSVEKAQEHQGYDYFDLRADVKLIDVPSSFVGVSGGGLWQVDLLKKKDGEIVWDEKRYFRGVAFWESEETNGCRMIRCHGPKSIFEKAWKEWGLPS